MSVLALPEAVAFKPAAATAAAPAVVFDKVSLAFDGNVVLNEISFSVRHGRMTVLLGASVKLRDVEHVTPILVTHQLPDAFYIATHEAIRLNGRLAIVPAGDGKAEKAEFIMLRHGRIYFEGDAAALKRSTDSYLKSFLSGWVPPLI